MLAVSPPAPARHKPKGAALLNAGVAAEMPAPATPVPAQKCENWAWAAGVETILRTQDVPLDQHYWVIKSDGGEVCLESLAPLERIAGVLTGDYVLDDNRRVRLEARVTPGAPTDMGAIIVGLRRGQPALMAWKGHAYLIYGVVYDEYLSPVGYRYFNIREIKLLDPFYAQGDGRLLSFVFDRDDPAEIGGTLEITVIPDKPTDWMHRN